MSNYDLTPDSIKQQHAEAILKSDTFKPQGITEQHARTYLNTNDGAMYWWRVAQSSPSLPSVDVDRRAIGQLMSGRELPRMESIETGEPLIKFVAERSSPTTHSPFWMRESQANAAIAEGRNISDYFGLPAGSEAPRYGMYRMTAEVPTQIFVNTVAPTSELGGLITKSSGAEQVLVPNRQLFKEPIYIKTVDNIPSITAEVERGAISPRVVRGGAVLGAAAVIYDATAAAARTSDLLQQGNITGAQSQLEHFAGRSAGGAAFAVAGAEIGSFGGPFGTVVGGAIGGGIGVFGGDKLAEAYDNHRIYNQTDAQGMTWNHDPDKPQQGWTCDLPPLPATPHGQHLTADPALTERLNYQANSTAVELALGHPASPQDPYSQPAGGNDAPSKLAAPWIRDADTQHWSRQVTDQVMEHGLTSNHTVIADPQRAAQLDAAAQKTIAANLAHSPHGMAEHYRALYEQQGWQKHGPMPDAVTDALKTPAHKLEASDGHTYTQSQNGQWQTPGTLWGTNVAEGHVRAELDATDRAAASSAGQTAPALAARDPRHPDNPHHGLYEQLKERIPEASEARLLQFTDACNTKGIGDRNLGEITLDDQGGHMIFYRSLAGPLAIVDLKEPPPRPEQSIQHVQQTDRAQAQIQAQIQAQNAQLSQQQPQGPMLGGQGF